MSTATTENAEIEGESSALAFLIKRVHIQGYKSLADCNVTLEPLTIFVGRNGSGKSNFLDALGFLSDLMVYRVDEAVERHGGWRSICCRTSHEKRVSITANFETNVNGTPGEAVYSFTLCQGVRENVVVDSESLTIYDQYGQIRRGFSVKNGAVSWLPPHASDANTTGSLDIESRNSWDGNRLVLSVLGTERYLRIANSLRAGRVYSFHIGSIRKLHPLVGSYRLAHDGDHLSGVIDGMAEFTPDTLNRVVEYLSVIVPQVKGLKVVRYGDYKTIRFDLSDSDDQPHLEFDAASMSDGTLRATAALVACYQWVPPDGLTGFTAIEEPETALHPAAMQALVSALDESTARGQVILTTHSPDLLDAEEVRPENVRVVQMIGGRTVIGEVDDVSRKIVEGRLSTLGTLERENQLFPKVFVQSHR